MPEIKKQVKRGLKNRIREQEKKKSLWGVNELV